MSPTLLIILDHRIFRDPRNSSVNNVGIDTDVKGCECKFDIRSVSMLKYAPLLCADTDAQNKCKMLVSYNTEDSNVKVTSTICTDTRM